MSRCVLTRRDLLKTAAAGGLASAFLPARALAKDGPRPNFLFILTDDQCFRGVGYNNPIVKTPHIDALAKGGLILDRAYIASPICVASRASLHTGLFPQQHGSVGLDGEGFRKSVVDEKRLPTVAELLTKAGYRTALCGKSHLGPPTDYGFKEGVEHTDISDDAAFAFAHEFLESQRGSETPFMLWLATRQPHVPLIPPQKWLDLYKDAEIPVDPNFLESPPPESIYNQGVPGEHYYRDSEYTKNYRDLPAGPPRTREQIVEFTRAYYATISRLDHQIGELVEQLKATGQYENTVLFFIGDNGYHLGNHGLGNKITMHEESARVPMFVHWPKMQASGVRCDALVSSTDVCPTMLDLAWAPIPKHLVGRSMAPLFSDPSAVLRPYVASECVGVGGKRGEGHRMVRSGDWKYVLTGDNEEALFNEATDPYELTNVADVETNQAILKSLRGYMREWMDRVGDTHQRPPA